MPPFRGEKEPPKKILTAQEAGVIKDFSFVEKLNEFAGKKNVILNEGYEPFF